MCIFSLCLNFDSNVTSTSFFHLSSIRRNSDGWVRLNPRGQNKYKLKRKHVKFSSFLFFLSCPLNFVQNLSCGGGFHYTRCHVPCRYRSSSDIMEDFSLRSFLFFRPINQKDAWLIRNMPILLFEIYTA